MRVLVSGAGGFIGRAFTASLESDGHEVLTATHRPPGPGEVGIDLANHTLDASRLEGRSVGHLDAAVHLAGAPLLGRLTPRRREVIRASRVATGDVIARFVSSLSPPPRVYLSQSAVGYYGDGGEAELDESSPSGEGFLAGVCRAWEASAEPAAATGIRTVTLRTGVVIGPGGGAFAAQARIFRLGLGGRLGSGRQYVSWISLSDEVAAIRHLIDDEAIAGPVNLTAPEPVRNERLTRALAAALGRPALFAVPEAALRLVLGQAAEEMLLAGQRVLPRRLEESGFTFRHSRIEGAFETALGRPPRYEEARARRNREAPDRGAG